MHRFSIVFFIVTLTSTLYSCESTKPEVVDVVTAPESPQQTQCKDPRPQMCTKEYRPVCATRDTGVRCVTTPCPSTELVTKGNACTACADEKVFSYIEGACG